jgi:hypothetical protein
VVQGRQRAVLGRRHAWSMEPGGGGARLQQRMDLGKKRKKENKK